MRLRRLLVMNPSKIEEGLFHQLAPPPSHHDHFMVMDPHHHTQPQSSIADDAFSLAEIDLLRPAGGDTSSDGQIPLAPPDGPVPSRNTNLPNPPLFNHDKAPIYRPALRISPDPHISSQFYTFNEASHALMIECLIKARLATPEEIQAVTPPPVLASWRTVWKDRSEDTAYLTAWKRVQDKLVVHVEELGSSSSHFLCFKNNFTQRVSHVDQWQDIVMSFHGLTDFKHLGSKETIDRIKQVWAVGKKIYGIPESYIRTCVAACPACSEESSPCAPRSKRRRFEYTESFDVPAKDVPVKLQQLAIKHKVVLCIRQKYIRYKPIMAEVKDYACHRAGSPASTKKARILKRDPYTSKRCGCGFRIRAIVPISNYNDKDKSFVYEEEGTAVFKLYAVHSGHEPGPLDGNARIMHRVVGYKGGLLMDYETLYGIAEEGGETDGFGLFEKDSGELHHSVPQLLQDLRKELGLLEGRIGKLPPRLLGSVSRELFEIVNRIKSVADEGSGCGRHLDEVLVVEHDLPDWGDDRHNRVYGDGKDADVIEDDDEDSFGRTLGEVASWNQKDLLGETCKEEKWLKCAEFDVKGFLGNGNGDVVKLLSHDEGIDTDVGLGGIHVDDGFYPENPKWLDSPCVLDPGGHCGDGGFRHDL